MNFLKTVAGLVTGAGTAVVAGIAMSMLGMQAFDFQTALIFGAVFGASQALLNIVEPQDTFTNTYLGGGLAVVAYLALTPLAAMTFLGMFGAAFIGAAVGLLCAIAESVNNSGN